MSEILEHGKDHRRETAGQPPFVPTAEHRKLVEGMAGVRVPQDHIAKLIFDDKHPDGISDVTLCKYFRRELDIGHMKADALLRQAQWDEAVNKRNPTMLIWCGKQYLGQREPKQKLEHSGAVMTLTPEQMAVLTDEQLAVLSAAQAIVAQLGAAAGGDSSSTH